MGTEIQRFGFEFADQRSDIEGEVAGAIMVLRMIFTGSRPHPIFRQLEAGENASADLETRKNFGPGPVMKPD